MGETDTPNACDEISLIMHPVENSVLNWWQLSIDLEVDPEDASTLAFSDIEILDYSDDSADDLEQDASGAFQSQEENIPYDDDASTIPYSESSEHGTVEEFIGQETCKICMQSPSAMDAVEINERWVLEGRCYMLIYGVEYLKCSKCFLLFHLDCLSRLGVAPASPESLVDEWECHQCSGINKIW